MLFSPQFTTEYHVMFINIVLVSYFKCELIDNGNICALMLLVGKT